MAAGFQGAAIGAATAMFTSAIGGMFGATFGGTAKTLAGKIINEVGRASAHSLVQGAFTYMQGGDFWAGAASGFISSAVGHTGQLVGIHGWGTVGVSAVSGGLVALVGKDRSVEDVLLGIVSGAMVGVFNAAAHEKDKPKIKIIYFEGGFDGKTALAQLTFDITDPRINAETKVYQMTEVVYDGEYEKEWDYDKNIFTESNPKYPFAYYVGNQTIHFTDTPSTNPWQNGDYFKGRIYFVTPGHGAFFTLNWGWKIVNNQVQIFKY